MNYCKTEHGRSATRGGSQMPKETKPTLQYGLADFLLQPL